MFMDKLGNIKEIADLKEKRDYIEEKFRIWEKFTKKKFSTNPLKGMQDFYPEDLVRLFIPRSELIKPFSFRSICSQRFLTSLACSSGKSFLLRKISFRVTTSNIEP